MKLFLICSFPLTAFCQQVKEQKPVPAVFHINKWTESGNQFQNTPNGAISLVRKTDGTITINDSSVVVEMPKKERATYQILSYGSRIKNNQVGTGMGTVSSQFGHQGKKAKLVKYILHHPRERRRISSTNMNKTFQPSSVFASSYRPTLLTFMKPPSGL